MVYVQPAIVLAGRAFEYIGGGTNMKGRGTCHDSQSVYLPSMGAYEIDE